MIIYLKNKETNEIIDKYQNINNWDYSFIEYYNGEVCKIYCDVETEYFTDKAPENMGLVN